LPVKEWPEIPSNYELINIHDGGQDEQRLASNIHVWKSSSGEQVHDFGCKLQCNGHDMNNAALHTLGATKP